MSCPLGVDVPEFIRLIREAKIREALKKIKEQNALPAVCGRICSAPCEKSCVLSDKGGAIRVRMLERYVADSGNSGIPFPNYVTRKGKKVAVVGSGPAGLMAARQLAENDFQVTVFEAMDKPGGVLRYAISEFRVPESVLDSEIREIQSRGVVIKTNFFIGRTLTISDLKSMGFSAILLATGAMAQPSGDIAGLNWAGVYLAEEFLMNFHSEKRGHAPVNHEFMNFASRMVVIGSNPAALDCARIGIRLGKEVKVVLGGTEDDLEVNSDEKKFAGEEGVVFEVLTRPLEILGEEKGFVRGVRCVRVDYADPDSTGQWQLKDVGGSEFVLDADMVVVVSSGRPNTILARMTPGLAIDSKGAFLTDEATGMTSLEAVFAGGPASGSLNDLMGAMSSGKRSAENIRKYLQHE